MHKLRELDVVELVRDVEAAFIETRQMKLTKGRRGTVVCVYRPPALEVVVEFHVYDDQGDYVTSELADLHVDDLRVVRYKTRI